MSSCCQRSAPLSEKLRGLLEQRLEALREMVDASFIAVISADGAMLWEAHAADGQQQQQQGTPAVGAPLAALRTAATRFADTLQVHECPVIHVKGDREMFSCYAIGGNLLAMYSTPPSPIEDYDTAHLDARMGPQLEDLEQFLAGTRSTAA